MRREWVIWAANKKRKCNSMGSEEASSEGKNRGSNCQDLEKGTPAWTFYALSSLATAAWFSNRIPTRNRFREPVWRLRLETRFGHKQKACVASSERSWLFWQQEISEKAADASRKGRSLCKSCNFVKEAVAATGRWQGFWILRGITVIYVCVRGRWRQYVE